MDYILKQDNNKEIENLELRKSDKFYILVNLFIKKHSPDLWIQSDWLREKAACKRLVNKYKDFDFFYSLNNLQGKFNSLCGLMSKKYQDLDKLYEEYIIDKSKKVSYTLSDKQVIEVEQIKRKPQNILEFLDS